GRAGAVRRANWEDPTRGGSRRDPRQPDSPGRTRAVAAQPPNRRGGTAMRIRPMGIVAAACVVAASVSLVGCGPKATPARGRPTTAVPLAAAPGPSAPDSPAPAPISSAPATPAVKDLTAGNCTMYTKSDAVKLLGGVNMNNKALDIGTDGGTKIDLCSYID